jgi:hypothetical protein
MRRDDHGNHGQVSSRSTTLGWQDQYSSTKSAFMLELLDKAAGAGRACGALHGHPAGNRRWMLPVARQQPTVVGQAGR